MKTITVNAEAPQEILLIGRRGESGVTEVRFEVGAWLEEFGAGALALYVRRAGDAAAYPVALTAEDGAAVWTVSETDTNAKGYGRAELVLTLGTVVKKSAVWQIYVACDIGQPTGDPPDPYESWLETLGALGADTQENAQSAADSAADAFSSASDAADSAEDAEESAQAAAASAEQAAAAAAHGIPPGGMRGQVLTKLSDADFDAEFEDPAGDIIVLTAQIAKNLTTGAYSVETPPDISGLVIGDFERSVVYVKIQGYEERYVFYPFYVPSGSSDTWIVYRCLEGNSVYTLNATKFTSSYSWAFRENRLIDVNGQNAMNSYLNMASHKILNLVAGSADGDAVNFKQLNDAVSAVVDYVDTEAEKKLPLAGGTMTGPIAMGGKKITGLANGSASGDAVNLGQVSDMISTNSAYFRGSFASLAALQAVPWQTSNPAAANYVTNNDYAIVLDDEEHDDECWRYVYTTGVGWGAQYRINEAPLTVAQMAALNSGATAQNIAQIAGKIDAPASATAGDVLTFLNGVWVAAAKNELFVVEATTSPYTGYTEAIAAINAGKHLVLHAVLGMAGNQKEYWLTDYTVGTNSITFYVPDNAYLEHSYILETDGTDDTALDSFSLWPDSISANSGKPVASSAIYAALALKADAADLHNTAEIAVSSAGAVTQELEINTLYHFTGALTALTITFGAYASGRIEQYHFDFDSGSTAPTLTLPNTVTMPDGFTVEANTHYEIDILNGYGVVSAWATS